MIRRFRDLGLGVKQAIGFGSLLCVMAVVFSLLMRQVSGLRAEIDELSNDRLPRILTTFGLTLDIAVLRTGQLQHAVSPDTEQKARQAAQMVTLLDSITSSLERLDSLRSTSASAAAEDTLYRHFVDRWEAYQDVSLDILQYSVADDDESAVALIDGGARTVYDQFNEAADDLV